MSDDQGQGSQHDRPPPDGGRELPEPPAAWLAGADQPWGSAPGAYPPQAPGASAHPGGYATQPGASAQPGGYPQPGPDPQPGADPQSGSYPPPGGYALPGWPSPPGYAPPGWQSPPPAGYQAQSWGPQGPWAADPSQARAQSKTLSILAIVFGCLALLIVPPLFGVVAIILGVVAMRRHQPYALVGLLCGVGGLVLGVILSVAVSNLAFG